MTDLTTLANVKSWLGLTSSQSNDDVLLSRLISAVSVFAATWMNRQILSADYNDLWDGKGGTRMLFPNFPVSAVSILAINGILIPPGGPVTVGQPFQPGFFFTDKHVDLVGYSFIRGRSNIQVSYTAGYLSVPLDLEQAVIELITFRFREKERVGMASKAMAGETTSFIIKDVPPSVGAIFDRYKKVVLV